MCAHNASEHGIGCQAVHTHIYIGKTPYAIAGKWSISPVNFRVQRIITHAHKRAG